MSTAPQAPAWIEAEANKKPVPMHVTVHDVSQRHEYEALFLSTFDAYEDALERFTSAQRVEVKPLKGGDRAPR